MSLPVGSPPTVAPRPDGSPYAVHAPVSPPAYTRPESGHARPELTAITRSRWWRVAHRYGWTPIAPMLVLAIPVMRLWDPSPDAPTWSDVAILTVLVIIIEVGLIAAARGVVRVIRRIGRRMHARGALLMLGGGGLIPGPGVAARTRRSHPGPRRPAAPTGMAHMDPVTGSGRRSPRTSLPGRPLPGEHLVDLAGDGELGLPVAGCVVQAAASS